VFALTPDQFSSDLTAWAGAFFLSVSAIIAGAITILPKIAELKTQIERLFHLHDVNATEIAKTKAAMTGDPTVPTPTKA
jgi:hypothetical protein